MSRVILITGSVLGLLSIVLGAFGAHGLKELVAVEALQTFETGVKYQMYHALLLLFVGSTSLINVKHKTLIFYLTLIGVILFSGSIYGLATNTLTHFNFKNIGFVTPLGGVLLIAAWSIILIGFFKNKNN